MISLRRLPGLVYSHKYTVYSAFTLLLTVLYILYKWNIICVDYEARHHVDKVCQSFEDGIAMGTLCIPLCTRKEINSFKCHSFHSTKDAVFSGKLHDTKLVFKMTSPNVQSLHWYDNGILKYPNEKEFTSTIKAITMHKLNITLPNEMATRLTKLRSSREGMNVRSRQKEMENLWVLIQDNEFLISSVYSDKNVFPQVLGTCGNYFAVEYVESLKETSALMSLSDSRTDWGKKLRSAVLIMDLLEELETGFHEPFHLCDVKMAHFGMLPNDNKVKFLDLDGVYPKSVISKIIKGLGACSEDAGCDYLDCRSKCSTKTKTCSATVTNNNLQIVCEKIFVGWRMSNTILLPGLLISEHTPAALASVLRQCAHPDIGEGKARTVPHEDVRRRLYNILTELDQSVNEEYLL